MAKPRGANIPEKGKGAERTSKQDAKMADITTAASSTMEPRDYSAGYPANENEHLNMNFSGKKPKGST